jgi:hypothetical protein
VDRASRFLHREIRCPACGNDVFEVVFDGSESNLLCRACWTCWHWDLGWLAPVPVLSCRACTHRAECATRARRGLDALGA